MLAALTDMGCRDSRLDTAWEWMARAVTKEDLPVKINPDGLAPGEGVSGRFRYLHRYDGPVFACQTNKHMSCGWGGVCVMMAFSRLPVERRTGLIERAIQAGVDFFLDNEPAKAGFPGHRAGTPDPKWWQFKFPDFWPSDVLKLAEAFTTLGYGNDPRLADTLQLVRGKQDDNGRWALDYVDKTRKMWVKYGAQGKPNKWITLRAMHLLKRVGETG